MFLGNFGVIIIIYFHDIKIMVRTIKGGPDGVCFVDNSAVVDNSAIFNKIHLSP